MYHCKKKQEPGRVVTVLSIILTVLLLSVNTRAATKTVKTPDGVAIVYDTLGNGETGLVFIHGWACNRSHWENQLPFFAKKYRVAALDLGGHGQSGTNRKDWSMKSFARDVVAVVNHLNVKKVILVAHSLAGIIMAEASKMMPAKVIGLVGVDTFHDIGQRLTPEQIEMVMTPLRNRYKVRMEFMIRSYFFSPDTKRSLIDRVVKDMTATPPQVAIPMLESGYKTNLVTLLKSVKVPLALINSDRIPVKVETAKKHIASFSVRYVKKVSHYVMMENPEAFNRLLDETVKQWIK
jgi:pimeloyl-ACP methyl ester carboxylesterase